LLWGLLGRLGWQGLTRRASTLRGISSLWRGLRRRGIAENFTFDRIAETARSGLLICELLGDVRAIAGFLINRSIRTECLIAEPLQRIAFAVQNLVAGSLVCRSVGTVGAVARLLPGVALSVIGGVAEALKNLAVAAISLLANFLARDLSAARARQAEPQDNRDC
jgi:hypothetical protein